MRSSILRLLLVVTVSLAGGHAGAQTPSSAIPAADALAKVQAAARTMPAPPLAISPTVRLRLSPLLGNAMPDVQALVRGHGNLIVAEPADYLLGTLKDYPNTLTIDPARGSSAMASGEPTVDDLVAAMSLPHATLGNLILKDYASAFGDAIERIGRAKALLALGGTSPAPSPTLCVITAPTGSSRGPLQCALAGMFRPVGDTARPTAGLVPTQLSIAVRNEAKAPRYLYVVIVHDDYRADVIALNDGRPVGPHIWAEQRDGPELTSHVALVTIASARPLPSTLLGAPGASPSPCDGQLGAILCGKPVPIDREAADWSGTTTFLPIFYTPPEKIGNGVPVPDLAWAPYMAQIYSTVPFTSGEIAADAAKPSTERLFLAERTAEERNHRCGASLIGHDLVLTAAHCVGKDDLAGPGIIKNLQRRRIRLGSLELGEGGKTYAIDAMAVHAGYTASLHTHDIALIRIRADAYTSSHGVDGVPIALPTGPAASLPAMTPVRAFGWGFTRVLGADKRELLTDIGALEHNPMGLLYGNMEMLDGRVCLQRMGLWLDQGMRCAVSRTHGPLQLLPRLPAFSCVGDSGGPLVRDTGAPPVLIGIASWSKGCSAAADNASVYTSVAYYMGWINAAKASLQSGKVMLVDDAGKAVPSPPLPAQPRAAAVSAPPVNAQVR